MDTTPEENSISISKWTTTTTSVSGTTWANWGLISERRWEIFTSTIAFQAFSKSTSAPSTTRLIRRFSMAVNSRPSILNPDCPDPPKRMSTSEKITFDSTTKIALPLSGSIRKMCRLVGTGSVLRNSPNFIISTDRALTPTTLRSSDERLIRNRRANFSVVISKVGIRPRMIRSWLVRS